MAEDSRNDHRHRQPRRGRLSSVDIDSFNIELKDDDGFSRRPAPARAPSARFLMSWRKPAEEKRRRSARQKSHRRNSPRATSTTCWWATMSRPPALVHSAIEEFAQELAYVDRPRSSRPRRGRIPSVSWSAAAFGQSRVGELAIARADIILKAEDFDVDLVPIRFHPDDAGLIGTLHLAPSWIFEGHDSILAVDIGGTNIRCGVVETRWKKTPGPLQGHGLEIRAVAARR